MTYLFSFKSCPDLESQEKKLNLTQICFKLLDPSKEIIVKSFTY